MQNPQTLTGRMHVFDGIRGISIILVVLGHVLLFMNLGMHKTVLSSTLMAFRMPLFFFISGYFAFKPVEKWVLPVAADIAKRKIKAQVLCTLVFFTIYSLCMGKDALSWLKYGFGGYWFTVVLFQIFMIFMGLSVVAKKWGGNRLVTSLMVVLAAVTATMAFFRVTFDCRIFKVLSGTHFLIYFQFFTCGLLARRYNDIFFEKLLKNKLLRISGILLFFGSLIALYSPVSTYLNGWMYRFTEDMAIRYAALLCVLCLFSDNAAYFQKKDFVPRALTITGQRTLDIYMLHYFFLPSLPTLGAMLSTGNMFIIQLAIAGAIAIAIVVICMLISSVLRSSDFISQWLFGTRPRKESAGA